MAEDLPAADSARVLRAVAHPIRGRILDELAAVDTLRAADVAEVLHIPANQASFHLRQLAKYGLVEPAPDAARDKRDRVWRATHPRGMHIDVEDIAQVPGGKAAMTVFQRTKAAWAHGLVEEFFALKKRKDTLSAYIDTPLRLTKDEAGELVEELSDLAERWSKTSRSSPHGRTYILFSMVQPYPEERDDS